MPLGDSRQLAEHRQAAQFNSSEDFVFARLDGSPEDRDYLVSFVLYPAVEAAGIERSRRSHGFHFFRHSAGGIAHSETGDVKLAQELLGHARLSTTADIYTHVDKVVAERACEALAKAIFDGDDDGLASERLQRRISPQIVRRRPPGGGLLRFLWCCG
jgi:integrase